MKRYRILLTGEAMTDNRIIYMTGTLGQAKWRARQETRDLFEHVVINIFEDENPRQPVAIKGPHGQQWIDVLKVEGKK